MTDHGPLADSDDESIDQLRRELDRRKGELTLAIAEDTRRRKLGVKDPSPVNLDELKARLAAFVQQVEEMTRVQELRRAQSSTKETRTATQILEGRAKVLDHALLLREAEVSLRELGALNGSASVKDVLEQLDRLGGDGSQAD